MEAKKPLEEIASAMVDQCQSIMFAMVMLRIVKRTEMLYFVNKLLKQFALFNSVAITFSLVEKKIEKMQLTLHSHHLQINVTGTHMDISYTILLYNINTNRSFACYNRTITVGMLFRKKSEPFSDGTVLIEQIRMHSTLERRYAFFFQLQIKTPRFTVPNRSVWTLVIVTVARLIVGELLMEYKRLREGPLQFEQKSLPIIE